MTSPRIIFVICVSTLTMFAQDITKPSEKVIGRGKIYTNGSIIEGENIIIKANTVNYYPLYSTMSSNLELTTVEKITEYRGNYSNTGMWIGGIVGGGIGIAVALGTKEEKTERQGALLVTTTSIKTWPIYVFTLGGLIAGALIGTSSEDWGIAYSKSKALLDNINIQKNNNTKGFDLTYTFRL